MPPRSIGSGTISFGLVTIPVKLYSATSPTGGVHFNLLHKSCGSRLKQQYLCLKEGTVVERDDMVKGYEFQKDRYVSFTPEELKELEEPKRPAIEIQSFVPLEKVDPVYFEKPYYLGPDKGGDKAYRLLAQALEKSGRAALARWAARGKDYLVLIRPLDGRLVMQQLVYSDEVRPYQEIEVGDGELKKPELDLALRLIEQTSTDDFKPGEQHDAVKARVEEAIQKKIAGEEISISAVQEPHAQVIDLMDALKASLEGEGRKAAVSSGERKPAKRAKREGGSAKVKTSKK
jgi:DNA end-binding protein Ku